MKKYTTILCFVVYVAAVCECSMSQRLTPRDGCSGREGQAPLCCQQQDASNSCHVYGSRVNNVSSTTCFCDNDCSQLGDCCLDYRQVCQPVDCVLAEHWEPYGRCDSLCGWGTKTRQKRVLVEPKNGGKACPWREEKLNCFGHKCKNPRSHSGGIRVLRETAMIIPAQYGNWRKTKLYNPYRGIRKNLFDHYNGNSIMDHPTYCATYEITDTRKTCRSKFFAAWAPQLQKGTEICVECQPLAMKEKLGMRCNGHGVYGKESRWNAITVPGCHGKWVMKTRREECSCNNSHDLAFILI